MAYTETTTTSWLNRLGGSIRGIGFGAFLVLAGTVALWWNEGDFVATRDALDEAQGITQELGDITTVNTTLNGRLVHATGHATTTDTLTDPAFQISTNALRLERTVEFYQWVENSKSEKRQKLGGGEETVTTYTYATSWTKEPVSSSAFKDPGAVASKVNTVLFAVNNNKIQAENVTFGAYRLPGFLVSSIGGASDMAVAIPEETLKTLNKQTSPAPSTAAPIVPYWEQEQHGWQGQPNASNTQPREVPAQSQMVHVSGSTVYIGQSPASPSVGDVRITFKEVRPTTVSILAKLNGDTFEVYQASNGKRVSSLHMGTSSLENMYGSAHSSNETMTWVLRVVGTLCVIIGLKMILGPISVVASVIPLLGSIVGAGIGLVSGLLGTAWSLLVIAVAWLRFRPIIGCIMVAVAVALIALAVIKGKAGKAKTA